MRYALFMLVLGGCLETKQGTGAAIDGAALCDYQVRCGFIGASEAGACKRDGTPTYLPFLDGRALGQETAGYSTDDAIRAGRLAVDAERRAACDAALSGACTSLAILSCVQLFVGQVPPDGACEDDRECAGSGICAVAMGDFGPISGDPGCPGRCVARGGEPVAPCGDGTCPEPGGLGDPCELPAGLGGLGLYAGLCVEGLWCDGETCREALADGVECSGRGQCAGGHPCIGLTLAPAAGDVLANGRCGPWGDAGAACDPDATVNACPLDMRCEGAVCRPRPVPEIPLGGACDRGAQDIGDTCAEGSCDASGRCALVCGP